MLAGLQSEIKQLQAEEARRQAQLAAEASARLAAQERAAASAANARKQPTPTTSRHSIRCSSVADATIAAAPPVAVQRRRRRRDAVSRRPVRLGRRDPGRIRLLRLRFVCLRAGRCLAPAQRRVDVRLRHSRCASRTSSRATSSSSAGSATWASTSAAGSSSTLRTPATSSRSPYLSEHGAYVGARRTLARPRRGSAAVSTRRRARRRCRRNAR